MNLSGKRVLVNGASSGIGAACAVAFAREGCRLMLAARRRNRLDVLAEELRGVFSAEVMTGILDVRDRSSVDHWVEDLADDWRRDDPHALRPGGSGSRT